MLPKAPLSLSQHRQCFRVHLRPLYQPRSSEVGGSPPRVSFSPVSRHAAALVAKSSALSVTHRRKDVSIPEELHKSALTAQL